MNYLELENKILNVSKLENVTSMVIGKSLLGKHIYAFHLGNYSGNQVLIEGAIHAREYITTLLMLLQIEYLKDVNIANGGIYFIPLSNPDGVSLVLDGVQNIIDKKLQQILLTINNNNPNFSLYKANANGVDINVNFDALWGKGALNQKILGSQNFIGYYKNSEIETQNLINFVNKIKPKCSISYHSKGEVIYYGFETLSQENINRDYNFVLKIANITKYFPVKTENSTGGFSDYVSDKLKSIALTIEVGNNNLTHPITNIYLNDIFEQNKDVPMVALNEVNKLYPNI